VEDKPGRISEIYCVVVFRSTGPSVSKIEWKMDNSFLSVAVTVGGVWIRYGRKIFLCKF